ncbi:MAG: cobalamin-binding protein [Candidatus Rokubacteria bacterium]|nr:cobalamin-binding protein [Candidatus Rokubacteria bacterium]
MTTLVDASGVALDLAGPPRRIVCLIPSTTELLCHLGVADAIVGISAYCVEPRDVVRTKRKVGGEKNPDLDAIRALAPDLVIANKEENVREHVETLRGWGLPVWVTYPRTVTDTIALVREIGAVTGTAARADALAAELEIRREEVRAVVAGRPPARVFYPIWRDPYMTVNRDTYIHDVLSAVGAENVFGDAAGRYPAITLDAMAERAPDVIVLPDEPFRFRRAHLKDFEPYRDVPAVRDGRIHLMDGKLFCWHGPRLGEALRTLPTLFAR